MSKRVPASTISAGVLICRTSLGPRNIKGYSDRLPYAYSSASEAGMLPGVGLFF